MACAICVQTRVMQLTALIVNLHDSINKPVKDTVTEVNTNRNKISQLATVLNT
jgi:hypothetical protein